MIVWVGGGLAVDALSDAAFYAAVAAGYIIYAGLVSWMATVPPPPPWGDVDMCSAPYRWDGGYTGGDDEWPLVYD